MDDDHKTNLKPIDLQEFPPQDAENSLSNHNHNENFREETASELVDDYDVSEIEDGQDNEELKSVTGWVSIALSVISFFILPYVLAVAGIIVGWVARGREAPILGNIAIVIGALSIIVRLFILPLI